MSQRLPQLLFPRVPQRLFAYFFLLGTHVEIAAPRQPRLAAPLDDNQSQVFDGIVSDAERNTAWSSH
jgi:hypothetical protein